MEKMKTNNIKKQLQNTQTQIKKRNRITGTTMLTKLPAQPPLDEMKPDKSANQTTLTETNTTEAGTEATIAIMTKEIEAVVVVAGCIINNQIQVEAAAVLGAIIINNNNNSNNTVLPPLAIKYAPHPHLHLIANNNNQKCQACFHHHLSNKNNNNNNDSNLAWPSLHLDLHQ